MRKNILIFGHGYATQFIDIYNQYTRLFDKTKYAVTVAYLTGEPNELVKRQTIAEEVIFFNFPKKTIRGLKIGAIRKLLRLCREKKFQIVVCHRYKPSYIMMCVAPFCAIPALFFVMHELGTMSSLARRLSITCLARPNMLLAGVSNAVRDDIRQDLRRVPPERIVTLYNMIDMELTEPQMLSRQSAREALHLSENAYVFGNLARLVPNKDQHTLIHAFSLLKPHCPQAKLLILGSGSLETALKEQAASLGLTNDVLFAGFLPNGSCYMKAFDCFVLSSIQEAFGRVLLEAMLAKVPVIATRVHGIPEVVGDAGMLVPPKNPAAFAAAMQTACAWTKIENARQGEKGYERVVRNFSIPRFQEDFWELSLAKSLIKQI